jgi:hypothetical protein
MVLITLMVHGVDDDEGDQVVLGPLTDSSFHPDPASGPASLYYLLENNTLSLNGPRHKYSISKPTPGNPPKHSTLSLNEDAGPGNDRVICAPPKVAVGLRSSWIAFVVGPGGSIS